MASSDKIPVACPASTGESKEPMGDPTKTTTTMLDKGTSMMQSMKPIRQMGLHVCSFACYSHDPGRQIEVHIYGHRVNQDFLQCAVYDSNTSKAHLIGTYTLKLDCLFRVWLCVYVCVVYIYFPSVTMNVTFRLSFICRKQKKKSFVCLFSFLFYTCKNSLQNSWKFQGDNLHWKQFFFFTFYPLVQASIHIHIHDFIGQ